MSDTRPLRTHELDRRAIARSPDGPRVPIARPAPPERQGHRALCQGQRGGLDLNLILVEPPGPQRSVVRVHHPEQWTCAGLDDPLVERPNGRRHHHVERVGIDAPALLQHDDAMAATIPGTSVQNVWLLPMSNTRSTGAVWSAEHDRQPISKPSQTQSKTRGRVIRTPFPRCVGSRFLIPAQHAVCACRRSSARPAAVLGPAPAGAAGDLGGPGLRLFRLFPVQVT